jgi:hypothetical protein
MTEDEAKRRLKEMLLRDAARKRRSGELVARPPCPLRSPSTVNKRAVWSSDGAPFAHPVSYLFLCYRLCVFSHFR